MFRDLETMHKLIKEYCTGKEEEVKVVSKKEDKKKDESGDLDDLDNDDKKPI